MAGFNIMGALKKSAPETEEQEIQVKENDTEYVSNSIKPHNFLELTLKSRLMKI